MPFAYQRMLKESMFFKDLSAEVAVTNIRIFAVTVQVRRLGKENSDVMEHGGFYDKVNIRA